jgi:hypothetical protein
MRTKLLFQVGPSLRPKAIALVERLLEEAGIDVLRSSDPVVGIERASSKEELASAVSAGSGVWVSEKRS